MNRINVFVDNVNIDTQTTYSENGKININRCPYEENPHLVQNGDGTSCFRPYAHGSGSRYNTLFQTAHGSVKETLNDIIVQLRFPKRLGKALIEAMFKDESEEVAAFIKTRTTETNWSL